MCVCFAFVLMLLLFNMLLLISLFFEFVHTCVLVSLLPVSIRLLRVSILQTAVYLPHAAPSVARMPTHTSPTQYYFPYIASKCILFHALFIVFFICLLLVIDSCLHSCFARRMHSASVHEVWMSVHFHSFFRYLS